MSKKVVLLTKNLENSSDGQYFIADTGQYTLRTSFTGVFRKQRKKITIEAGEKAKTNIERTIHFIRLEVARAEKN